MTEQFQSSTNEKFKRSSEAQGISVDAMHIYLIHSAVTPFSLPLTEPINPTTKTVNKYGVPLCALKSAQEACLLH